MASPSLMSRWPEHMHVDEGGKGDIRCVATGCKHTFKPDEKAQLEMVKHYKDEAEHTKPYDTIKEMNANWTRFLQHRILRHMYKLRTCLVCGADFKLPDSERPDSRALFEHNRNAHPDEKDVSTIRGFIIHVRKFPNRRAVASGEEKVYWEEIFDINYQHMECALKTEKVWNYFNQLLGYPDSVRSEDRHLNLSVRPEDKVDLGLIVRREPELRKVLTVDGKLPIHPDRFLCALQYDEKSHRLPEDKWLALWERFKGFYREADL